MSTPGRSLSLMIYGQTKTGKSTLAATAPKPILMIDTESAARFLPGKKMYWDPMTNAPPEASDDWDVCIVRGTEYGIIVRAIEWVKSGKHPFESVVLDSLSEAQKALQDQIAGLKPLDMRAWGEMLRNGEHLVRQLRDLTENPVKSISAVVITAMAENRDGTWQPYVQGQLRTTSPYMVDVLGYYHIREETNEDPAQGVNQVRSLLTRPVPGFIAGERVQGRLPQYMDNPSVTDMLDQVFGKEE